MKGVFPKNFLWGAATSSHQIEGGLTNSWSKWEQLRVSEPVVDGLGKWSNGQPLDPDNYLSNSKYSCESFKYYKEDVKVLKKLGLKAYRFSIEWSRIEPEKGVFDFKGLEYYRSLVEELRKNDIEPVVTLWHWTLPLWLEEEGGVFAKRFKGYFIRMTKQVVEILSEDVTYWITFNEPEVYPQMSYLSGEWTPNRKNIFLFFKFYFFIFPTVHKAVYTLIKGNNPNALVSFAKNNSFIEPYNRNLWNVAIANMYRWISCFVQVDLVKGYLDYIGLNFYFHNMIGIRGLKNVNDRVTDLGWWYRPESIEGVIRELWERYRLPIMITENGLADSEDKNRAEWLDITVKAMENCIRDGVTIIGYLHWSLLDNFEWAHGFWPKFGLVSVNPESKERVIKESALHYSNIVKKSGII